MLHVLGIALYVLVAWLGVSAVIGLVWVGLVEVGIARARARARGSERLAGPESRARLPHAPVSVLTGGERRRRDLAIRSKGDR